MKVVYLDQNKWVELARAVKYPARYPKLGALLELLKQEVSTKSLALPLSWANLHETFKINNPQRRHDLASVQAELSRGLVLRGSTRRLDEEVSIISRRVHGMPPLEAESYWFLSDLFPEAMSEWDDKKPGFEYPEFMRERIRSRPAHYLYEFLVKSSDEDRIIAVRNFSNQVEELRKLVEDRRQLYLSEPFSTRRKRLAKIFHKNYSARDIRGSEIRQLETDVPTFHVERELMLRIEAQSRPIEANDFMDMQAFCAAVPYTDMIVSEKQFASLAIQSKLDQKYSTRIVRHLAELEKYLSET
jgi:hypothetical protein